MVPTTDEDDDFLFGSKLYLVHLLTVSSSDYHCKGNEKTIKLSGLEIPHHYVLLPENKSKQRHTTDKKEHLLYTFDALLLILRTNIESKCSCNSLY